MVRSDHLERAIVQVHAGMDRIRAGVRMANFVIRRKSKLGRLFIGKSTLSGIQLGQFESTGF